MSTVTSSLASAAASTASAAWNSYEQTGISDDFFQYQAEVRKSMLALLTPLNITIVLGLITLIYLRTRTTAEPEIPGQKPIVFRTFTPRTLLIHNGVRDPTVYIGVRGKVYDVTPGKNFYGPGGPYENFAGRDATRGLACQSFDDDMLTKDLDGPLDPCEDLDDAQLENLKGWIERFDEKYLVVGKLVPFNQNANVFR